MRFGARGGCQEGTAISDWLQAEREVLEEFIEAYIRARSRPWSSRPKSSVNFTRRKAKARILKRGRTIAARDPQSISELGKTRQALATFTR